MRPCTRKVENIAHGSGELFMFGPNCELWARLGFEGRLMANLLLHALGEKWLDVKTLLALKGN